MSLKPGFYLISGVEHDSYLGTGVESKTAYPKPIVRLPGGVRAPIWEVVKTDHGCIIKVTMGKKEHLPVSPMDGLLYAFTEEPPRPELWEIQNSEKDGKDIFLVRRMNGVDGWVIDQPDYSQIKVRPLIMGPSHPPTYPPNQLFRFVPHKKPMSE